MTSITNLGSALLPRFRKLALQRLSILNGCGRSHLRGGLMTTSWASATWNCRLLPDHPQLSRPSFRPRAPMNKPPTARQNQLAQPSSVNLTTTVAQWNATTTRDRSAVVDWDRCPACPSSAVVQPSLSPPHHRLLPQLKSPSPRHPLLMSENARRTKTANHMSAGKVSILSVAPETR